MLLLLFFSLFLIYLYIARAHVVCIYAVCFDYFVYLACVILRDTPVFWVFYGFLLVFWVVFGFVLVVVVVCCGFNRVFNTPMFWLCFNGFGLLACV